MSTDSCPVCGSSSMNKCRVLVPPETDEEAAAMELELRQLKGRMLTIEVMLGRYRLAPRGACLGEDSVQTSMLASAEALNTLTAQLEQLLKAPDTQSSSAAGVRRTLPRACGSSDDENDSAFADDVEAVRNLR